LLEHADTILRPASDVFSRPEAGGRVFLQRPGGTEGPVVKLLREQAGSWWQRIESGVRWDELVTEANGQRADLDAFLGTLQREGFIDGAPAEEADERSTELFEDPYLYQFTQPSLWSPWYVLWEVTDRCSQSCSFCYNPERQNVQVGLGEAERVVAELARLRVPFVTLLGGEPLANVHLPEIIAKLHAHRIYTKVITSGIPLNARKVQALKEAGLDQIALSLDALTPETNDATRGPGSFAHFERARELLGREIRMIGISLSVSTASLPQLDGLAEFAKRYDIDETYLSQLRAVPGIQYPPGVAPLGPEEIGLMHQKADEQNRLGHKTISLRQCSCGRSSAVVQADGLLRACPFATTGVPLSQVQPGDLADTWATVKKKGEQIGPKKASSHCYSSFSHRA
jgi:hypothetical protein